MDSVVSRELREARQELARALLEWRDAAGDVLEVVAAIEQLAREVARDESEAL